MSLGKKFTASSKSVDSYANENTTYIILILKDGHTKDPARRCDTSLPHVATPLFYGVTVVRLTAWCPC